MEAEMSKHRITDLKNYMANFKKEILKNYHLKERCEIEDACVKEFEAFNLFWEKKAKEFEQNVVVITEEFEKRQKERYEQFILKVSQDDKIKKNCITNDVLNLQKVEVTLAKQKNYIEAQNARVKWQELIKENFNRFKSKAEKERLHLIEEFEKRQKKETVDFAKKIEDLREEQVRIRKSELDKLIQKYDKLKSEIDDVHNGEKKAIDKDLPIVLNDGKVLPSENLLNGNLTRTVTEKKKTLLRKIDRLDYNRKY